MSAPEAAPRGARLAPLASAVVLALTVGLVGAALALHGRQGAGAGSAGPSPRDGAAAAFDSSHGVVVLFGGRDAAGRALDDTWTWDGSAWTQRHPSTSPPARGGALLADDPARHDVLLVGGQPGLPQPGGCAASADCALRLSAPAQLLDTWSWDGGDWHRLNAVHALTGIEHGFAAYDAARREVVVVSSFGGALVTAAQPRPEPTSGGASTATATATAIIAPHGVPGRAVAGVPTPATPTEGRPPGNSSSGSESATFTSISTTLTARAGQLGSSGSAGPPAASAGDASPQVSQAPVPVRPVPAPTVLRRAPLVAAWDGADWSAGPDLPQSTIGVLAVTTRGGAAAAVVSTGAGTVCPVPLNAKPLAPGVPAGSGASLTGPAGGGVPGTAGSGSASGTASSAGAPGCESPCLGTVACAPVPRGPNPSTLPGLAPTTPASQCPTSLGYCGSGGAATAPRPVASPTPPPPAAPAGGPAAQPAPGIAIAPSAVVPASPRAAVIQPARTVVWTTLELSGGTWKALGTAQPRPDAGTATAFVDAGSLGSVLVASPRVLLTLGDAGRWTERQAADGPGQRYGEAIAGDPQRNVVVLVGGVVLGKGIQAVAGDTWTWDGQRWTLRAGTPPSVPPPTPLPTPFPTTTPRPHPSLLPACDARAGLELRPMAATPAAPPAVEVLLHHTHPCDMGVIQVTASAANRTGVSPTEPGGASNPAPAIPSAFPTAVSTSTSRAGILLPAGADAVVTDSVGVVQIVGADCATVVEVRVDGVSRTARAVAGCPQPASGAPPLPATISPPGRGRPLLQVSFIPRPWASGWQESVSAQKPAPTGSCGLAQLLVGGNLWLLDDAGDSNPQAAAVVSGGVPTAGAAVSIEAATATSGPTLVLTLPAAGKLSVHYAFAGIPLGPPAQPSCH